jgi:hypothetical protein
MIELMLTIDFPRSNLTNKKAYDLSLDPFVDKYDTVEERRAIYDFCNMSYGPCSAIMFNIFTDRNKGVSEYHYQVTQPACQDSFNTPYWYIRDSYDYDCIYFRATLLSSNNFCY